MFVLFSAEEIGLLGSKHLAHRFKSMNQPIYAVFNIEMVGVPLKNVDYSAFLTGYKMSTMADRFNHYSGKNVLGFSPRSEEHTSELQSRPHLVCRLLLEKKKKKKYINTIRCERSE